MIPKLPIVLEGSLSPNGPEVANQLRSGETTVWSRPAQSNDAILTAGITLGDLAEARARMKRFIPALRQLFSVPGWDGEFISPLLQYPFPIAGQNNVLLKADNQLPLTGSIKARGGIYELLCRIELIAIEEGLISEGDCYTKLTTPEAKAQLGRHTISVASTGNLGFSIGLMARAFCLNAQVHMSFDAKQWKKDRLVILGADVIEHNCDYTQTVARARALAKEEGIAFIDDEGSRDLLIGYALAGDEIISQLSESNIHPTESNPLVVYLPCGVGGAPGGITFGLKASLGDAVHCVFVEPTSSACVMVAMALGNGRPLSVYDIGLNNETIADGLAVPIASELVLQTVGHLIDGVVALPDSDMKSWVKKIWVETALRIEPSAASALGAIGPYLESRPDLQGAYHVAWLTGGAMMPDSDFEMLVQ